MWRLQHHAPPPNITLHLSAPGSVLSENIFIDVLRIRNKLSDANSVLPSWLCPRQTSLSVCDSCVFTVPLDNARDFTTTDTHVVQSIACTLVYATPLLPLSFIRCLMR